MNEKYHNYEIRNHNYEFSLSFCVPIFSEMCLITYNVLLLN